jgi:hypothetical protein
MVTTLCLALVLSYFPFPLDEMTFDEKQSKAIDVIFNQYNVKATPLSGAIKTARGKKLEQLLHNMSDLNKKRDAQIEKLLTDEQKKQFAELSRDGVPMGNKFFRTSSINIEQKRTNSRGGFTSLEGLAERVQAAASSDEDKPRAYVATMQVANRSGRDYKKMEFAVTVIGKSGEVIDEQRLPFADVTDGKVFEIKVEFVAAPSADATVKLVPVVGR